ncbi:MAG: hypothetical protein JW395_3196 [Nitrospira sp.]|nr:hypothetical protein [Nitrospira sp.]
MAPIRLAETDLGYLEFEGNELYVCSKPGIDDPPKVRLLSDAGDGCLSINKRRFDGVQLEKVLIIGKDDPSLGGGVIDTHLQSDGTADDAGMKRASTQSLKNGLELFGVQPVPSTTGRFYHEGGYFCTIYQRDGHVVQYEIKDKAGNLRLEPEWGKFVVWTNWHGLVRPLPW